MRSELEAAIRGRIEAVAPQLVGDLWGRQKVTILITRLDVSSTSRAADGEAQAMLFADTPDAFPVDALIASLREPLSINGSGYRLRARLTGIAERIEEMHAVCRIYLAIEVMQ